MSVSSSYGSSPSSPRVSVGLGSCSTRALAVVTNKWYREQRRAEQDVTRSLTLLKQRKISCILKAESLQRGLKPEPGAGSQQNQPGHQGIQGQQETLTKELQELERKMKELEFEREERCRKIMHRRVQQVNTLQELGLLEAVGKESLRSRSEGGENQASSGGMGGDRSSPALSSSKYSPASSSSSQTSRRFTPPMAIRQPEPRHLGRPDPAYRLDPAHLHGKEKSIFSSSGGDDKFSGDKGIKLSPRIGRRNPLRMLSNAIDFRSRRKQRPKSADFEIVDEADGDRARERRRGDKQLLEPPRSASVTDLLESVTISKKERVLEGRNSAPDIIPNNKPYDMKDRLVRHRPRGTASTVVTKQKLSTRFQPQRKPAHRISHSNSVRRAKTFNHGGPVSLTDATSASPKPPLASSGTPSGYTTLPKQSTSSSRSLGSTSSSSTEGGSSQGSSTDSGQGTASSTDTCSTASRKSSNSSYTSSNSEGGGNNHDIGKISQSALDEIAAFEKFIDEYFQNANNNVVKVKKPPESGKSSHRKVSSSTALAEILELSI